MPTYTDERQESEVVPGLRREWMFLIRHRWLVLVCVIVALSGAALVNFASRPLYEGVATISIGEAVPGAPNARLNVDPLRIKTVLDKEIARITSREFAARVVKQATPTEKAELAQGPLGLWFDRLRPWSAAVNDPDQPFNTAEAVGALRSRLRPEGREPSTWVSIQVSAYDPAAAAQLANSVAQLYVAEAAEANLKTTAESQNEFESQVEARGKHLGEQLSGLRELGKETGLGDFGPRKAVLERQVRAFQEALVAAQTARVGRGATTRDATRLEGGALVSDQRVMAAQTRLAELEDREKALLATLGSKHPDVITVQEQVQTARGRLEAALGATERAAESAYRLAQQEEARIAASLARVQQELTALEQQSLAFTISQKRADASRAAVEQLIQRQENTSPVLIEAEIIQTAAPSRTPYFPKEKRNFLYSLAGGLAAGILLARLKDRFNDTVQSPDDIKEILGLSFLGMVPLVPKLSLASLADELSHSQSGFADGLRVVRTNLMFGAPALRPKVIVFTSASPGDGKSTVASGIALLLRETEGRVLIIDGDLRRPSVHELLNVPQAPGLSDLLAMVPPITLVVSQGRADGLHVLTAGPSLTISAARLGSDNMKALIAQAREDYDWVIIDSPPSLGLPDASVLATLADAVVIVSSGDKTPRQALRNVTDQLRSVGATVLGVVLNRLNMDRHYYYYGRYYSSYYGDANESSPETPSRPSTPRKARTNATPSSEAPRETGEKGAARSGRREPGKRRAV